MKIQESDRLFKGYSEFLKRCGYNNVSIEEPKVCNFPSLEDLYFQSIVPLHVDSERRFLVWERNIGKNGNILNIGLHEVELIRSFEQNYSLACKVAKIKNKELENIRKVCLKHFNTKYLNNEIESGFIPNSIQLGAEYGVLVFCGVFPAGVKLDYGHTHPVSKKYLVFDFSKGHTIFVRVLSPIRVYLPSDLDIMQSYRNNEERAVFWLNFEKADYDLLRGGKGSKEEIVQEIARRNESYYEVVGIRYHMKGEHDISIGPLIPKS